VGHALRPSAHPRRVLPVLPRAVDHRRRAGDWVVVHIPAIENEHYDGILHRSVAPPGQPGEELNRAARRVRPPCAAGLVLRLGADDRVFPDGAALSGDEMAPRVHNSVHWMTRRAHTTSREPPGRSCGWPSAGPTPSGWSAMVQLHRHLRLPPTCSGSACLTSTTTGMGRGRNRKSGT